jgi:hypothetical protein
VRRVFTANCSSLGLRSLNQRSPRIWSSDAGRPVKGGGLFCETTLQTSPSWICSWSRPLASNCCIVIKRIHRKDLVWINVTTNPTAEWIACQIIPWDGAPGYMIRDRDRIYGVIVTRRLRAMGIRDKPIAPASPWQNGFAERLIGSIRRKCLGHMIVSGKAHLRRILISYVDYYNSLQKDAPIYRPILQTGIIRSHPILGGLHHHYVGV